MELSKTVTIFHNLFLILLLPYGLQASSSKGNVGAACGHCKYMVESFKNGLLKTEKQHFAGGNTDWEERKLGKFVTSETRFVEIMDQICKKFESEDSSQWDSLKDLQFKCNHLAEESEDLLEKWYFKRQELNPNVYEYVCIDELKKCCQPDHYGPNCSPCPGALKGTACFGNGKCSGEGTREGTGKCDCNEGYSGVRCSNCDAHYFPAIKNDSFIVCKACFDGCATGCTSELPTGCFGCRTGYKKDEELGCIDVNECEANPNPCQKANEECKNTQGHYSCECLDDYRRNFDTDECELDVHAEPYDGIWRPDRMLRMIAIGGLTGVSGFIIAFHRSRTTFIVLALVLAVFIYIERKIDQNSFSENLHDLFKT